MRFPYQGYPVRGIGGVHRTLVYRPTAPIRIVGPGGDALAYGLLDTGADDTLLPDFLLKPLGVQPSPGDQATIAGIGGATVRAQFARVDFELRRGRASHRWSATVGFDEGSRAILGQNGVLEYFLASFNHRLRVATLRLNDALPPPSRD